MEKVVRRNGNKIRRFNIDPLQEDANGSFVLFGEHEEAVMAEQIRIINIRKRSPLLKLACDVKKKQAMALHPKFK